MMMSRKRPAQYPNPSNSFYLLLLLGHEVLVLRRAPSLAEVGGGRAPRYGLRDRVLDRLEDLVGLGS